MKKITYLFVFSLYNICTFAQNVDIKVEDIHTEQTFDNINIAGVQNGEIILNTDESKKKYEFLTVNAANLTNAKYHKVEYSEPLTKQLEVVGGQNKLFVLNQTKIDKAQVIQAISINAKTNISKAVEIMRFENDKTSFLNRYNEYRLDILKSADSTKFALFIRAYNYKKGNEFIYMSVFDMNLKKIWEQEVELPVNRLRFGQISATLTNESAIILIARMNMKDVIKATKDKTIPENQTTIFIYDGKQKNGKQTTIDTKGKNLQDILVQARSDNKNTAIFSWYTNYELGFISNYDVIHGLFYMEITPEGAIVNQYQTPIDASKIPNLTSTLRVKKDNGLVQDVSLRKAYFRPDGNVLLVSEYIKAQTRRTGDFYYTDYTMKDAIVFCMNPQGKINWSVASPKSVMAGYNRKLFSFATKNTLFLACNSVYDDKDYGIVISEIDAFGKIKNTLLKGENANYSISSSSKLESKGEVIFITAQKNKNQKIVRITGKE